MKIPNYLYHTLALLWLYSGVISLCFQDIGIELLSDMGFIYPFYLWVLYSASLLDILFALLIMTKLRHSSLLWLSQLIIVIVYHVLMIALLPKSSLMAYLIHPFAPIIKNLPIMAVLFHLYQYHRY